MDSLYEVQFLPSDHKWEKDKRLQTKILLMERLITENNKFCRAIIEKIPNEVFVQVQ